MKRRLNNITLHIFGTYYQWLKTIIHFGRCIATSGVVIVYELCNQVCFCVSHLIKCGDPGSLLNAMVSFYPRPGTLPDISQMSPYCFQLDCHYGQMGADSIVYHICLPPVNLVMPSIPVCLVHDSHALVVSTSELSCEHEIKKVRLQYLWCCP